MHFTVPNTRTNIILQVMYVVDRPFKNARQGIRFWNKSRTWLTWRSMSWIWFSESAEEPCETQFQFMSFLPTIILMYRQMIFQTCLDIEIQAGLSESPAEESWLNRYHSSEITAFLSWYINNFSCKRHRSSKTLAKWNNTHTQNTGTSGNNFHKKNRLQSTFFSQIHCFPTSVPFLNYSQVIFEMGFGLINHTASWKMFLVPPPNNSSFDWCKTKQKQKKPKWTSDLGEWESLFVSTRQPTGDSELWTLKLKCIFMALLAHKTRAALGKHMHTQ